MKKIILAMILLSVLILSGCQTQENVPKTYKPLPEGCLNMGDWLEVNISNQIYSISEKEHIEEVDSEGPLELYLSGVDNIITIKEGTDLRRLILTGAENIINLPDGLEPEIIDCCVNCVVNYYS